MLRSDEAVVPRVGWRRGDLRCSSRRTGHRHSLRAVAGLAPRPGRDPAGDHGRGLAALGPQPPRGVPAGGRRRTVPLRLLERTRRDARARDSRRTAPLLSCGSRRRSGVCPRPTGDDSSKITHVRPGTARAAPRSAILHGAFCPTLVSTGIEHRRPAGRRGTGITARRLRIVLERPSESPLAGSPSGPERAIARTHPWRPPRSKQARPSTVGAPSASSCSRTPSRRWWTARSPACTATPVGDSTPTEPAAPATRAASGTSAAKGAKSAARKAADKVPKRSEYETLLRGRTGATARTYATSERFAPGELINHASFGLGVVTGERDSVKIDVHFADGPKVLMHGR